MNFLRKLIPHKHDLQIIRLPKLFLKDGHHTRVIALKCWCGHKDEVFPSYNLQLAYKEGTDKTIQVLDNYGLRKIFGGSERNGSDKV